MNRNSQAMAESFRSRLDVHFGAMAVACATVAAVGVPADNAEAVVVYRPAVNINIPTTTAGVYLNVVTGVSNASPTSVPGWDVNPWSTTGLGLFNPTAPTGGVYVGTAANGTQASNLTVGTLIGASSLFGSNTSTNTAVFNLNSSDNIIGFRFQNEANGNQVHYGWMRISLAGTATAQPRAIVEYAYEDQAGVSIAAGVVPASGVCCRGATCSTTVNQAGCTGSGMAGANFVTTSSTCNSGPLSSAPCCYANYNKANGITVQDIFDFLGDWFAGNSFANTGGNGAAAALSVQNIFDFLTDWFAGGCS